MSRSKCVIVLCIQVAAGSPAIFGQSRASAADAPPVKTTSGQPPRKVIVGTALQPFWGAYPGLDKRLEQLAVIIDRMAAESTKKYGRGLDLAVLPETAVTGEIGADIVAGSVPFAGAVQET